MGDVDGNGNITAADARLILRASVGLNNSGFVFLAADCDGDTKITAADARLALRAAVGLSKHGVKGAKILVYSANGYEIYSIDGVTYIDGIIIVNKTYSLPKSYAPGGLTKECGEAFKKMQSDAQKLGLSLYNSSGYRSFDRQKSIYEKYVQRDGVNAADRYSARPGFSEHQTGLAIDLNTITRAFANTREGKWVAENCAQYGFILRYPQNKENVTGYIYEPWHIRFVGKAAAKAISSSGLTLEEYFGISSSYKQ